LNNFLKKHHKLVGSKRSHFLCPGLTNGSLSLSLSHDHFFSSAALKMMQKHHNFWIELALGFRVYSWVTGGPGVVHHSSFPLTTKLSTPNYSDFVWYDMSSCQLVWVIEPPGLSSFLLPRIPSLSCSFPWEIQKFPIFH
jgi:hypothetical protein